MPDAAEIWGDGLRSRPRAVSLLEFGRGFLKKPLWEDAMQQILGVVACAAALLMGLATALAQETVKIGLINVLSGQFADAGTQLDNGIKTYIKQHGDTVAGKKIELIRKDVGGPAPDIAKRFAQELVVRDNVDLLAGFVLTPNALAAADVSAQAKKFMVVMNAATSVIITKSPYMIRTSVTLPQVMETFGPWAANNGIKQCYTMAADYGPGHDAEAAFQRAFKKGGGEIVGSVRFPVANPDFSAFVQRAKDLNPQCIYIFVPGGAQHRPEQDQSAWLGRNHQRAGSQVHGRLSSRHDLCLALRLQEHRTAESGVRASVQPNAWTQS